MAGSESGAFGADTVRSARLTAKTPQSMHQKKIIDGVFEVEAFSAAVMRKSLDGRREVAERWDGLF